MASGCIQADFGENAFNTLLEFRGRSGGHIRQKGVKSGRVDHGGFSRAQKRWSCCTEPCTHGDTMSGASAGVTGSTGGFSCGVASPNSLP